MLLDQIMMLSEPLLLNSPYLLPLKLTKMASNSTQVVYSVVTVVMHLIMVS